MGFNVLDSGLENQEERERERLRQRQTETESDTETETDRQYRQTGILVQAEICMATCTPHI